MSDESVKDAIIKENTDFFDATFQASDELKSATHGDKGYSLLHLAAGHSTERMVKYFLDKGFSLDCRTFYNQTALHVAVMHCKCDVVRLLLQQGSPPDAKDSMGRTALHYAMETGKIRQISLEISSNIRNISCSKERSGSHNSFVNNMVMEMIRSKFNEEFENLNQQANTPVCTEESSEFDFLPFNFRDIFGAGCTNAQKGDTSCCTEERSEHYFTSTDNRDIINHLLHYGADVNASTKEEDTPLFQAIDRGSESLVRFFLKRGANINHCKKGYNALHYAALKSNKNIVEVLLDAGAEVNSVTASQGRTPLHLAASCANSEDIVDLLIECGAMVNAKDYKGETPILRAVGASVFRVDQNVTVNNGIDNVNHEPDFTNRIISTQKGETPILRAVDASVFRIDHNVIVNNRIDNVNHERDFSPLASSVKQVAYMAEELHDTIDKHTLNKRASHYGYNEPQTVDRRHHIIRSLLNAGAEVNHSSCIGEPAFHRALSTGIESIIELFLERGADVHSKNVSNWSALHVAVKFSSEKVVRTLIARGAPVDVRTSDGRTPLHLAVKFGREMHVKLLLARGADVNATDANGFAPLHYITFVDPKAWKLNRPMQKILTILLDKGADPLVRSVIKTPLVYAVIIRNDEVIKILLRQLAHLDAIGDSRATEIGLPAISNNRQWILIYEKYQREVVGMKKEKIYANVTYFDMITLDLRVWVQNDEFVKAFKNNQTIKEFYYYDKVLKKFNDALIKKEATEYLTLLFSDLEVPIPIFENVVKYCEPEDLEKFVQSFEETEF